MPDPSWSKLYYSVHALEQFSIKESRVFGGGAA